ncbi:putative short chain oxidoreductase/dehydrogenase [Aspergillus clavatus NRRL 1]|uniref:Short chain oxidoreductase/dehydrogenase, putative n=1 Tax=Aspergillus clavatus (strain ATCC 1007 / CBS 513.65 / DSM 816 / NCTC 3887 / NRRL 1 / QM 1276 / 107) TaxID=344612 RepID=A1CSB7_ASPCL|nr:short chain oxidoreductase/dehydrogenase, putative [Aspergillus clavatus NRRL 1]EAW08538.1 short chain oxidoreductase/dehydrogenase, putative [Aspergillus clavatus NRRL 1]
MATSQTWLITGASSGFGTILAEAVLKAGHRVIATARDPVKAAQTHPQIESLGGVWLQLDVTRADAKQTVEDTVREQGRIDVVVNNAGYGLFGSVEDMSEEEIHQQINTNVYGPIRVIKAVLPFMRAQKSGTIVNISSIAGLQARPSVALYNASKFALEGFSEALSQEVAPFNIRVLIVEPGMFRTNFLSASQAPAAGLNPAYQGTILEQALQAYGTFDGRQAGDPVKAVERLIDVAQGTGVGAGKTHLLRLPLGRDSIARARTKLEELRKNLDEMEEIASSTDY